MKGIDEKFGPHRDAWYFFQFKNMPLSLWRDVDAPWEIHRTMHRIGWDVKENLC